MRNYYKLLLVAAVVICSTCVKAQSFNNKQKNLLKPHELYECITNFNTSCKNQNDYTMTVDSIHFVDESWGEESKMYYQYDWKNRIQQEIKYSYEASKFDYQYDDENGGNLLQVTESYILNKKDGGEFEPVYYQHYYYTDDRLTKFEYETWMDYTYWMVTDRIEYEYDEEGNMVSAISSALVDWTEPNPYMDYSSKECYTYENGLLKTFTYYQYGDGGGYGKDDEWTPFMKSEYDEYDENGNYHVRYSHYYEEDWVLSGKEERNYDENGNMVEQSFLSLVENEWVVSQKICFNYIPSTQFLSEQIEYESVDGVISAASRSVFEYDAEGNREKALFYTWEDEEWVDAGYTESTYGNYSADIILGMQNAWEEYSYGIGGYAALFSQWTGLKVEKIEWGETVSYEYHVYSSDWASASVNEISANSLSHSVYPNPFSGNVTINAAEPVNGVATFTIYNTIGEMVYSSTMNCNETTEFRWNAADNANGVYLYQISTEKGMIQGRVVKE